MKLMPHEVEYTPAMHPMHPSMLKLMKPCMIGMFWQPQRMSFLHNWSHSASHWLIIALYQFCIFTKSCCCFLLFIHLFSDCFVHLLSSFMLQWNLWREATLGTGCLVLVDKLVPSQRFSFKFIVCHYSPLHNSIKIKYYESFARSFLGWMWGLNVQLNMRLMWGWMGECESEYEAEC